MCSSRQINRSPNRADRHFGLRLRTPLTRGWGVDSFTLSVVGGCPIEAFTKVAFRS